MSIFDNLDLTRGELPGWINNMVALARPIATTLIVAIAPVGAFTVGAVAAFRPKAADAMASASIKFLQGIPDAGWGAIVAIALGYTAAKTAEVVKGPAPPSGRQSPEGEGAGAPVLDPEPELSAEALRRLNIPEPQFGGDEMLPEYAR